MQKQIRIPRSGGGRRSIANLDMSSGTVLLRRGPLRKPAESEGRCHKDAWEEHSRQRSKSTGLEAQGSLMCWSHTKGQCSWEEGGREEGIVIGSERVREAMQSQSAWGF